MAEHLADPNLYKELYYKEFEVKAMVDEQIDDITQVIIVLSGAFYFLAQHIIKNETLSMVTASPFLFLCGACILSAITFDAIASVNSTFSGNYEGIPSPLELLQEQKEIYMRTKQKRTGVKENIRDFVELEFDKRLVFYYSEAGSHNQNVNDKRLSHTYKAKLSIIASFVSLALLGTITLFNL